MAARLSYKFQRLREQLRTAIVSGQLAGRLPGERDLGRQFGANAKTINKALSDLSAEGLVIRRIGRGTFVAGSNGSAHAHAHAARHLTYWWITPDAAVGTALDGILDLARRRFADELSGSRLVRVPVADLASRRTVQALHGGLRGVAGLVLGGVVPDETVMAEILRRHIPTVLLGDEPDAPRVDSVVPDGADAGFRLTEYLVQLGQRQVVVVSDLTGGPLLDRVYTGYHAACRRRQIAPRPVALMTSLSGVIRDGEPVGLLTVGGDATRAAVDRLGGSLSLFGKRHIAAVVDAGDALAEKYGLTVYETPVERMVDWAVRLLHAWRPGQPPVQVVVPGRLNVRGAHGARVHRTDNVSTEPAEAIL